MDIIRRSLPFQRGNSSEYRKKFDLSEKDYYLVRCQANGFYLREELKSYKLEEGDHVQVIGGELSESSILSFLWMFKQNPDDNTFQIIHARTDLSLASDDFECEI